MLAQDFNRYSPPDHDISSLSQLASDGSLSAHCVKRGWISRTINLTGRINAEVRYIGWTPGESVLVDGVLVGKGHPFYFTVVNPRIDFAINYLGVQHSGTILAQAPFMHMCKLERFSLIVDGQIL